MQLLLRGLLTELYDRCTGASALLSDREFDQPVDRFVLSYYRQLEQLRRDVDKLLKDPALGDIALVATQFQAYRRMAEVLWAFEAFALPVITRFNDDDRFMTGLCECIIGQSRIPIVPPLVTTASTNYYWTTPYFNLVWASALECNSILGLPDLYHEVGHILIEKFASDLTGSFLRELQQYVRDEQRRAILDQRPGDVQPYDLMLVQWQDRWIIEFVADLIATYMVGEV